MSASPAFTLTKPSGTALLQACKAISTALSTSAGVMEGVYLDILRAQREHAPLSGRSEAARPAVRRGASSPRKVGRGPAMEGLPSRTGRSCCFAVRCATAARGATGKSPAAEAVWLSRLFGYPEF